MACSSGAQDTCSSPNLLGGSQLKDFLGDLTGWVGLWEQCEGKNSFEIVAARSGSYFHTFADRLLEPGNSGEELREKEGKG